jgi:hypothetical protein
MGADDRQAVGDSLGIGHAVTFVVGGEDEHVGFRVERRKTGSAIPRQAR